MPRSRRTGLSRLGVYLGGQRPRVACLSVIAMLGAAGPVIGLLLVQDAIDNGMKKGDTSRLTRDVIIYFAVNAAAWVLTSTMIRGLARVGQGIVLALREHLFEHLTSLSLRYFSEQRAGWIIARLTSDVDAVSDVLSQGLTTLVANTLTLVAAVIGLFILDWRLGLVALIILPPTLVLTRWFQVRSHAAFLDVRNTISGMTAQIAESVSGMAVIQAFNRERAFQAEFDEANRANLRTNQFAQWLNSLFFPAIEIFGVTAIAAVLLVGGHLHDQGSLTVGTLISAVFLLNLVFQPLQELSDLYGQVQSAGAAMEKISSVLDTEPEIRDPKHARTLGRIDGRLDLDEIWFAYGAEPVLRGVDLHFPAGSCIALVGHTGHGKSTLAKLIGRFYDPDRGRGTRRRARPARGRAAVVPASARRRPPGSVPLRGDDRGQHPLRAAGRDRRAGARDRGVDRRRSRRRALRGRTRPRRARGRRGAFRRRAAADLDRARAARRSADPHPRRGDVEHRPADGDPDRERARPSAARTHVARDRAQAGDRASRGRDPRRRARPDRAARNRARAARVRRPVPPARARPAAVGRARRARGLVAGEPGW